MGLSRARYRFLVCAFKWLSFSVLFAKPKMDSESDINDRKRKLDSPPRRSGFGDGDRCCEVVVSNIPYEFHWQKLKDLIRDKVGEVGHVKIWQDDGGRHKGAGVAVFPSPEQAKKAVDELNRHDVNGRQLVVKMFTEEEKRKRQRMEDRKDDKQRGSGGSGGGRSSDLGDRLGGRSGEDTNSRILEMVHTIMNSDPSVLKSLGVNENVIEAVNSGQLSDTVFVANVDYAMKWQDLKDIFKMAGNVLNVKMVDGTDGKTKGYGTIQFKSPLDALEAVAKFHGQTVRDRRMTVKIDQMSKNKVSIPELMADFGPRNPPHQEMMPARPFGYGPSLGGVGVPPLGGLGSTSLISRELELERLALQREREKILMQSMGSDRPSFPGVGGGLGGEFGRPFPPSRSLEPPLDSFRSSLPPPIPQMERPDPRGGDLRQEEMKLMKQLEMIRSQIGSSGSSMSGGLSSMTSTFGGASSLQSSSSFGRDMLSGGSAGDQANPALAPGFGRAGAAARTGSSGGSCQIFIRNLPFQVNWQMLKDRFSEFGKVLYAEIKMENGKSKGCGIVRFSLPQEAENAIMRMNGKVIDGREIEVRFDSSGL